MKSGIGKGLAQLGETAMKAGFAKADLNFKNRYLASQYGWRLGLNDPSESVRATSGIAGGIARPTGVNQPAPPKQAAAPSESIPMPTDAVGPFRLPGAGRMPGGSGMQPGGNVRPRMMGPTPGASDLLRRHDEEAYT